MSGSDDLDATYVEPAAGVVATVAAKVCTRERVAGGREAVRTLAIARVRQ